MVQQGNNRQFHCILTRFCSDPCRVYTVNYTYGGSEGKIIPGLTEGVLRLGSCGSYGKFVVIPCWCVRHKIQITRLINQFLLQMEQFSTMEGSNCCYKLNNKHSSPAIWWQVATSGSDLSEKYKSLWDSVTPRLKTLFQILLNCKILGSFSLLKYFSSEVSEIPG